MSRRWAADATIPDWLRGRLSVDPRALAAFRIGLGTTLLLDVLTRLRHFRALYTDAGVLPRSAVLESYGGAYDLVLSLPDPWFPAGSFLLVAAAALALIAGYRSRLGALCALVGLVTIQMRNPFVLNGGDVLLRILVLWAIFLPLDRCWAVSTPEPEFEPVVSVATTGAALQVALVYVVNATHKLESEAWRSGEAVADVFRTEQYTYLLADALGDALVGTGALTGATYAWFALLLASPLLLLSTGRLRTGLVSLFVAAHVGMLVTLAVGLFPLVSITSLLLLYPPVFWDRLARASERVGASARLQDAREKVASTVPATVGASRLRQSVPARVRRGAHIVTFVGIPSIILVFSLVSAAGAVGVIGQPDATASAVETADVGQDWGMFAPDPPDTTWWIAAPATAADGSHVDAIQGNKLDRSDPAHAARMPSFRWRKYFQMLRHEESTVHHAAFARYLCETRDLEQVTLYSGYQTTGPGQTESGGETLGVYDCASVAD